MSYHHITREELFAKLKNDDIDLNPGVLEGAKNGDGNELYAIGYKYRFKGDQYSAASWFFLAAAKDHPRAQFLLGYMYHVGEGVERDQLASLGWYLQSAKLFHREARYRIGTLFYYESLILHDKYKAAEWFYRYYTKLYEVEYLAKKHGCHLKKHDKKKSIMKLIQETEEILNSHIEKREKEEQKIERELKQQGEIQKLKKSRKPEKELLRKNFDPFIFHPKRK